MAGRTQSIVLMLDEIQDPRNFGALIRSAEVFGVDGILIPERNSVRINETVVKTSTGAIEYVPIIKVTKDRKSTRLNSSHANISYAVFCLKKKKKKIRETNIINT